MTTCIAEQVDVIIINPVDPQVVVPTLMEAKDAGIVIGLFSSDLATENQMYRDFFCGTNDSERLQMDASLISIHLKTHPVCAQC